MTCTYFTFTPHYLMKKIFLPGFLTTALFIATTNAQSVLNQTNIWYFNFNCGIDFNSGSPVSLNNGALYTYEGCTSISDSNGNLLFYSDGITVYNSNHQTMQNGTGLDGGSSTSQSCIAIRQPGSNMVWYLFTVAEAGGAAGARYSVIDMSLQGGLGEVVDKNIPLVALVEEKVTACLQTNGTDYWILFHGLSNNSYYAYPLTSSGVGSSVTTHIGLIEGTGVGCMKFSPHGNKLAIARYNLYCFEVFDFDKTTGEISNGFKIPLGFGFLSYGVEWSRDGKRLFMGNVDTSPGKAYEADMTQPDSTSINASVTQIANGPSDIFGSLQMAPDGKIYLIRYNNFYLGVINNPDSLGVACDYVSNGFSTSPHNNYLGLPNYVSYWFSGPNDTISLVSFAASNNTLCEKFCTSFIDSSQNNPTAWQWIFPGGNPASSTDQNPTAICYSTPGVYDVTLITTSTNGVDTLTLPNYITVYSTPPFPTIIQAGYLLTSSPASSYQWQLNSLDIPGATNQTYTVMQTGYYTVVIADSNGCVNSGSKYVLITGIHDVTGEAGISIFPNPSPGIFFVEILNGLMIDKFFVEVTNNLGQIVFSSEESRPAGTADWSAGLHSEKKQIDLSDATPGIYYIEINTGHEFVRKKILIAD